MSFIAEIPYGCYWSTPYVRWQGAFRDLHAIEFAAHVAKAEMAKRKIDPKIFGSGVMGLTVHQDRSFHGLPWLTGMIGAYQAPGTTLSQVCATGARTLFTGVSEIAMGLASTVFVATCDRTSNGPHAYYPSSSRTGGTGVSENVVLDSMQADPLGKHSMLQTAENVAKKHGFTTEQQHELVLMRDAQYKDALKDDRAFQKRFMTLPFPVPDPRFKKVVEEIDGDIGVVPSTAEGLAKLKPVLPGGTVTFGGQTHPADGNSCVVVTTSDKAKELATDSAIVVKILGFGQARVDLAYMPEAPVPAARQALKNAGVDIKDIVAIKTHNPFAVNDLLFLKETGVDPKILNNYGCSLIWGHPQGPTGLRLIIELIEELAARGGGTGMFTGCAAGDSSMAVVIKVEPRKK